MSQPIVGIHLDLKYLMPRKAFLLDWVRRLSAWGINTILIEYEDKFPFEKCPYVVAPDAFTPDELRTFLAAARSVGLRTIPLVQTLSHLEFALEHEQLASLREAPHITTQIDTSNPAAIAFVESLIDEVLRYHEEDEFIHLGGDEAWHLGHNPTTAAHVQAFGKLGVWAEHERYFTRRVLAAGKRPILWDDVFWDTPTAVATCNLPKETVLMSWQYSAQKPEKLSRVEAYHTAGLQTIGAPCLNWGVLTPQHEHCLGNTQAWAKRVKQSGMLGLINTAWACFHVLPHAQSLHIAATGAAAANPGRRLDAAWQSLFSREHFGAEVDGFAEARTQVSVLWEQDVGLGRPITPIIFGYMDMILLRTQSERQARGVYPLDWDSIDFTWLFREKIRLLREATDRAALVAKLHELIEGFDRAAVTLARLAAQATLNQGEARYFDVAVRLKALHARIILQQVTGEGDVAALTEQWAAMKQPLKETMRRFVEDVSLPRVMRLWHEPTAAVLNTVPAC